MYCVIQEIERKKENQYGEYKELKAYRNEWSLDGENYKYSYKYTGGRFERQIRKAYKISIHDSYRENGKVKKKQWVICTMDYYTLLESWPGDCIIKSKLNEKLESMQISEDMLWEMVYVKLQPIIDRITREYEATEEYRAHQEHRAIVDKHIKTKNAFESVYGDDTYDYCYDVFGVLRNKEKLEEIKEQHRQQKEYQRSYYDNFKSNYSDYFKSSYSETKASNHTEAEKEYLKIIYKSAAMKLHPDIKKDNGDGMKFLNKLKAEWNI